MQIAVAIALTILYIGLSLRLGGSPKDGFIWWFIVPLTVTFCTAFVADRISVILPVPWANGRRYSPPPRRVHLSWRAAIRLPVWAPVLLVLWHFLSILRMHFAPAWLMYLVPALVLAVLALVARRRRREILLLRDGEVTLALVLDRDVTEAWSYRIAYHFVTAGGMTVRGRAWDHGYGVFEGSSVPVFYDANNPRDHFVACASWFEAD